MINMGKYKILIIVSFIVVLFDQVSKAVIVKLITPYSSVAVIPGVFNITHIYNPGGAFGFMSGQSLLVRTLLFLVVSTIAMGFIFYFYKNTPKTHPILASGFALIFGGAIGNMIDRIRLGTVVDFLDFYIKDLHWPAFNIADSAISIGMAIFLFHLILKKMPLES
ncbi:MAG: signal peptidase II [Deltaproteobacteria bacterium]|nr:signal peptidase II [Deltaproteobacteria bacterium]MBW2220087.1 signal peptidase II [Deltaproteobacteria bacterium]